MTPRALREVVNVRVFVRPELWNESVEFYAGRLGIELRARDEVHRFALLGFERGPTLVLEPDEPDPGEAPASGKFTGFSFRVDDVDRVYGDLLAKGVEFVQAPETMFWGGRLAYLKDPSGNVLTLAQYPPGG